MKIPQTDVTEAPKSGAYFCEAPNDPCAIVMFGASGDLARRKLLPALYDLAIHACLAPRFRLLGFARTAMSHDKFRETAGEFLPEDTGAEASKESKQDFLKHLQYFQGDYDDPEAYRRLAQSLDALDSEGQLAGNRLFYL
ncbi:MAG: glucose-6-phosphate dehydrogenase, partial [Candidatus Acidiferrales bacterium]